MKRFGIVMLKPIVPSLSFTSASYVGTTCTFGNPCASILQITPWKNYSFLISDLMYQNESRSFVDVQLERLGA